MNKQKGNILPDIIIGVFILVFILVFLFGLLSLKKGLKTKNTSYLECKEKTADPEWCFQQVYGITINEE